MPQAYVHDLEEKIKTYDETSVTSSGSITDLRRELVRVKDTESHSSQYIAELEARLARADESVLTLRQTVERLEQDVERRRADAEGLQDRLDALTKDAEAWRSDLDQREKRVHELEQRMQEWERVRADAGDQRTRLGAIVDGVEQEKKALETPPASPKLAPVNGHADAGPGSEPATPVQKQHSLNTSGLDLQLVALQETHAATLADLSSVSAKYRDALREISDLASQIQELKLNSDAPSETGSLGSLSPDRAEAMAVLQARRRIGTDSPNRRLVFRHAASSESLHSRSLSQSLSLSQELSSAHGRKTSFSSAGTNSPLASPRLVRPPTLSISLPSASDQRTVASMKEEIMRLQEVLKEREAEIAVLETTLRAQPPAQAHTPEMPGSPESLGSPGPSLDAPPSASERLTPNTLRQFGEIRKAIGNGHTDTDASSTLDSVSEADENLDRLNELMRWVQFI
jgi:DNA repair exonuclease SbcCD ATPase subunit